MKELVCGRYVQRNSKIFPRQVIGQDSSIYICLIFACMWPAQPELVADGFYTAYQKVILDTWYG